MRVLFDYIIVEIPQKYKNDLLTQSQYSGGHLDRFDEKYKNQLLLKAFEYQKKGKAFNTEYQQIIREVRELEAAYQNYELSFNVNKNIVTFGTVKELPERLSDYIIDIVYDGTPTHTRYISGEDAKYNKLFKYMPTTFEPKKITRKDMKVECKIGDKLYFDYTCVCDENMMPYTKNLYMIPIELAYCYIDNNGINMMNDYVLCTKIYEEHNTYKYKTEKMLHAKVEYVNNDREIRRNDTIIHAKDADYLIEIEHKEYILLKKKEILMKTL